MCSTRTQRTKPRSGHISGPHFRDYHLLLDEQGQQIFETTDELAERVRKIGGRTLHSIGQIAKLQRIKPCRSPVAAGTAPHDDGGTAGSRAPVGNKNALKSGVYTRETAEQRWGLQELLHPSHSLINAFKTLM